MNKDEYYMNLALKEAKKAYKIGEVPVGAVIVLNDEIIAKAYNKREIKNNSLCHAEIIAINKACKKLNSWRLDDCTIYITLEPCIMCSGAIIQSRFKRCVYGASDLRFGSAGSYLNIFDYKFNHEVIIEKNILGDSCKKLIQDFFKELRRY